MFALHNHTHALLRAPAFSRSPVPRSGILLPVQTLRQSLLVPNFWARFDQQKQAKIMKRLDRNFRARKSADDRRGRATERNRVYVPDNEKAPRSRAGLFAETQTGSVYFASARCPGLLTRYGFGRSGSRAGCG